MRSAREIRFRLAQEAGNFLGFLRPPALSRNLPDRPRLSLLPDPAASADAVRGTEYAGEILRLAKDIVDHKFSFLGYTLDLGSEIPWRRDAVNGRETGIGYFRRIPYLDAEKAGDHKIIWELSRHQHLVTLAQAWRIDPRAEYLKEIQSQLESWIAQNPFNSSINWSSALEVGFRALSWIWIYHLVGEPLGENVRRVLREELYRHGRHLERNLSYYFSPNTHLLGESLALFAIGLFFPELPSAASWKSVGSRVVEEQMRVQMRDDGSHFEQSTYYHVYAVDMFLFYAILAEPPEWFREKLRRAARYLWALLGPAGSIPLLGDDDGGRFFHPWGPRSKFGKASLAACAVWFDDQEWPRLAADVKELALWWLGPHVLDSAGASWNMFQGSELFPDAGVAVVSKDDHQTIVDTRAFGWARAGHSHAHSLSLVFRCGDHDILQDPGTFTYTGLPAWRDQFRGTAAHNTIRIDDRDQADPNGPFAWTSLPESRILSSEPDVLIAETSYRGFIHTRCVRWFGTTAVLVMDHVEGPPGQRKIEQNWHLGQASDAQSICTSWKAELSDGWVAPSFGAKQAAPVLRVTLQQELPVVLAACIDSSGSCRKVLIEKDEVVLETTKGVFRIDFCR